MAVLTVAAGDEASLRSTVAGATAGDVVNVPPGTYALTAACTVTKGILIQGSGAAGATVGPTLVTVNGARNAITIDDSAADITRLGIRDIKFTGAGGALAAVGFVGTAGKALSFLDLRRLTASGYTDGINLDNSLSLLGAHHLIEDCELTTNSRWGMSLNGLSMPRIQGNEANASGKNGIRVYNCLLAQLICNASEGNNTTLDASQEGGAQMLVKLSHAFSVIGLDIEGMLTTAGAARVGLTVSGCNGGFITAVNVAQTSLQNDSYGVRFVLGSHGQEFGSMVHSYINYPISADDTSVMPSVLPRNIIKAA